MAEGSSPARRLQAASGALVLGTALFFTLTSPVVAEEAPPPESAAAAPATVEPTAAPVSTTAPTVPVVVSDELPAEALRHGAGFDLQIELGGGFELRGEEPETLLGRLRLGGLLVREPWVFSAGAAAEAGALAGVGFGVQLDAVHIWSGMSLEIGGVVDLQGRPTTHASLGYAIFGVEWQHRIDKSRGAADALFFKLRIPVGVLLFFLT